MKRFNIDAWLKTAGAELQVECAVRIVERRKEIGDSLKVVQTIVSHGVPPLVAGYVYQLISGKFPERVCVHCARKFRPEKLYYLERNSCDWCHKNKATHPVSSQRRHISARAIANVAVKRGKLTRQPCSICGAGYAEKHHPDYSKPLDVVWLCHGCHVAEHKRLRNG